MKHIFLLLTLFSSSAVMPMEQIYRYGIEPLSICGAAVLPGASHLREQVIGNAVKPQKSGPVCRAFSSYAKGLATKQSLIVLTNMAGGVFGSYQLLKWLVPLQQIIIPHRSIAYVPSPIDIVLDVAKDSDSFENAVAQLAETNKQVPLPWVKAALVSLVSFSVNRMLLTRNVEYMPTLGQLLERWQQVHAPYSPNILDKSWARVIVGAYACYAGVLTAEYYCRSFWGKRSRPSS